MTFNCILHASEIQLIQKTLRIAQLGAIGASLEIVLALAVPDCDIAIELATELFLE